MYITMQKRSSIFVAVAWIILIVWSSLGLYKEALLWTGREAPGHPKNITGLEAEDPALVAYLRDFEILKPNSLPYNLDHPEKMDSSQLSQSEYADKEFLHGLKRGFFVEAGAYDGEDKSNTLFFERFRGWTGLLIEPSPELFRHITTLNRKAYIIQAGLSFNNYSADGNYLPNKALGRIYNNGTEGINVKTFPLYSLLLALGVSQIDYLSLDIEGDELKVLNAFPWDKVKIRLMCIESNHLPQGHRSVVRFFKKLDYIFLGFRRIDAWFGHRDLIRETMDPDEWLARNKLRLKIPVLA